MMRRNIRLPTLLLLGLVVLYLFLLLGRGPGERATPPKATTEQALDRLLDLMQERLALMHDVARWKWNQKKPIADPEREQAFLDAMQTKAREQNLDPDYVRSFFMAQIEAAKLVQEADFKTWEEEKRGPFADAPDLNETLRPKIDQLSQDLLAALTKARPWSLDASQRQLLSERVPNKMQGIDADARQRAVAPLFKP